MEYALPRSRFREVLGEAVGVDWVVVDARSPARKGIA